MKKTRPADGPVGSRLYSIEAVAEHLGVSAKTIRRQIQSGQLTAYRIGRCLRVSDDDLQLYRARRRG